MSAARNIDPKKYGRWAKVQSTPQCFHFSSAQSDEWERLGYNLHTRMPTIWSEGGFDFIIYPNDHSPAHVHVAKAGDEVIINLGDADTLPSVRGIYRMRTKDVARAFGVVIREQEYFLNRWREIHGGS